MFSALLAKDLRRAWRNPLPFVINLTIPLVITALIGLAFGDSARKGGLGKIAFALVDEDSSPVTSLLRGAINQGKGGQYLEPSFLDRATALRELAEDRLSGVVIIPAGFTRQYLGGGTHVTLELIKNPARSIHPAVLEELLGVVVTGLNALARNLPTELALWRSAFEEGADHRRIADLIVRTGDRLEAVRHYLFPPLIGYEKEVQPSKKAGDGAPGGGVSINLFQYLLVGMSAMFLLFIAGNAMGDLHAEIRLRTLERYHTLQVRLAPFIAGKVVFAVAALLISAVLMLGGGGLVFRIRWQHPWVLTLLVVGYACFSAAMMALVTALVRNEQRSNTLGNLVAMMLALAGGCAFPPQQLPGFVRDRVAPILPTFWFTETVRIQEHAGTSGDWALVFLKLLLSAAILIGLTAAVFRSRFARGVRA